MSRTATAILYDGDDFDRLDQLRKALEFAEEQARDEVLRRSALAGELPDPVSARERYLEAVDSATERATEVIVEDIGTRRWMDLAAAHPPKPGNELDALVGYNADTFGRALLAFDDGDRRTIKSPTFEKKSDRDEWLDDIPLADSESILEAALKVNRGQVADPKDVRS